ncbi:MAG TPA: 23S ribosomal RNA methyltransferase Erm [Nitrolancea sp.]|jgi:23S rRNA (adenine-N6)-dimethyltransferase|nr:23S ribosomal RNA methyltransferase Erm [Nitrolancea sp.]
MAREQRKRFTYAQNFLIRTALARQVIEHAALTSSDLVLEIGPGRGMLTRSLATACRQVIAIEKDPTLAQRLAREVGTMGNVALFVGDFLDLPLPLTPYKVVGNIPFNITAAIVSRLTESANPPEEATLVLQREAADRFLGQPRQTLVALLLQPWFELSIAYRFRQADFVPPPRVAVVLLRFSKRGPPLIAAEEARGYRDFVTFGFTAWKPTIGGAFETVLSRERLARLADQIGFSLRQKPSELTFDQWLTLYRAFRRVARGAEWQVIDGAEDRLRAQQERRATQLRDQR